MKTHTYADCATNYQLWEEFVDPDGVDTEEFFNSLTTEQKIKMQVGMFGAEPDEEGNHYPEGRMVIYETPLP